MKIFLILLFSVITFTAKGQRQDSTKTVERNYSPGHYLKRAGNNLIVGTFLSIGSGVVLVITNDHNNNLSSSSKSLITTIAVVTEIISIGEYFSAGVNLNKAGKRMIELKM